MLQHKQLRAPILNIMPNALDLQCHLIQGKNSSTGVAILQWSPSKLVALPLAANLHLAAF